MVASGIPCWLFVSSRLLFDPLATTAGVFTQTDTSAKRRGSVSKTRVPGSKGDPKPGNLLWVRAGSLQASILTQWAYRAARRWQPGAASSLRFGAVGERKKKQTHVHMHFRSVNFISQGSRKLSNVARLHIAFVTALLVCLGHSDIWGGL